MSERKFSIGDRVDTTRWDRTVPPKQRFNGAVVVGIREDYCESGWLVALESDSGKRVNIDQNWLTKAEHGGA